jgi:folate-binding protein YgfZ
MEPFFVHLDNRGLVRVSGPDQRIFLQGLITNDIEKLDSEAALYACLLNAQGKFLHDFFITAQGDHILLECEGGDRAHDLFKRLNMYKLRADVTLTVQDHVNVYAVLDSPEMPIGFYPDPRHSGLGYRGYERPKEIAEKDFSAWDSQRIQLCIPDGSRDLVIGKSTMDEGQMDSLNAVSYTKGCYVGQELTARMHYRGLAKKRLAVVSIAEHAEETGELRSRCGDIGLALMPVKTEN